MSMLNCPMKLDLLFILIKEMYILYMFRHQDIIIIMVFSSRKPEKTTKIYPELLYISLENKKKSKPG